MYDLIKYPGFWLKFLVLFCWINLVAVAIWLLPHLAIPVKYLGAYFTVLLQVTVGMVGFTRVNAFLQQASSKYTAPDWLGAAMMLLGVIVLWLALAIYAKSPKDAGLEMAMAAIGIVIAIFGTTRVKINA